MKTKIYLSLVIAIVFAFSCQQKDANQKVDEGEIVENTYKSELFNWEISIPKDWSIVSKSEIEAKNEAGKKAVEEAHNMEVNYDSLQQLVSFAKNDFNLFSATAEPFEMLYEGEYEDNNRMVNQLIYETFTRQGLQIDTISSTVKIDGITFLTLSSDIYSPTGEYIISQELYSSYINGYDFSVNLNYNNEEDKATLQKVWFNSTFGN